MAENNPLDNITEPINPPVNDDKARLELEKLKGDHSRDERIQEAFTKAIVASIWIGGAVILFALVIRTCHLIFSDHYCWMSSEQKDSFDSALKYILTGSIGAFVGNKFKGK